MFLESLLETSTQAKNRRGWATLSSFLIQVAVIGALILAPMLYTDALPSVVRYVERVSTITAPPELPPEQPPNQPPAPPRNPDGRAITEFDGIRLVAPPSVPSDIYIPPTPEPVATPNSGPGQCIGCVPGGIGSSDARNPVLEHVLGEAGRARPTLAGGLNHPVPLRTEIVEGMLIRRVQPVYPQLAIITHVQGSVVLHAIIGRDGVIRQLQVASGHPLLVPAAVDAIRQWRYRPYYLNKQAVEVETEITVNFLLNR